MLAYSFLKGAEKWAPAMVKIWGIYKQDSEGKLNFQDTLCEFRRSYSLKSVLISSSAFAATLQDNNNNTSSKKRNRDQSSYRQPPQCVCGYYHLFRDCSYIKKEAIGPNFKENAARRADIKIKIQKSERIFNIIKKIGSDTGILDGIIFGDTKESKPKQQNFTLGNAALSNTLYSNTVVFYIAT